jgi:hypothetical protein
MIRFIAERWTPLLLAVFATMVLASCSSAAGLSVLPSGAAPADVAVIPLAQPAGTISEAAAIATARRQYGEMMDRATVTAYLVQMTDPTTLRGDAPIQERPIWLIRLSGIAYPISVPPLAVSKSRSVGTGWVYVDAYSGEWLMSRFSN